MSSQLGPSPSRRPLARDLVGACFPGALWGTPERRGRQTHVGKTAPILCLVLVLSACGRGPNAQGARECVGAAGSRIDVAHEPDWCKYADYRTWTTRGGCLVRIDVLADRPGADHCDWDEARSIITGKPLGTTYSSSSDSQQYVRDPEGVYGMPELTEAFDPSANLPADAVDTGYRQGDTELWTVPDDPSFIYLRTGRSVERWPLGTPPLCK